MPRPSSEWTSYSSVQKKKKKKKKKEGIYSYTYLKIPDKYKISDQLNSQF